jgi:hypothetical protein
MSESRTRRTKARDDNGQPDEQFPFGALAPDGEAPDGPAQDGTARTRTDAPADTAPADDTPDRWSAEHQGLDQDWGDMMGGPGKPKILKVEKPSKTRVFRVHPDRAMWIKTVLLVLKDENQTYLVDKPLRKQLPMSVRELCGEFALLPCISQGGTSFLWPIRLADKTGEWNTWHRSAWDIAQDATKTWVRLYANRDAGRYDSESDTRPPEEQPAPAWPDMTRDEWFMLAFQGNCIDSLEHSVIKRLMLRAD